MHTQTIEILEDLIDWLNKMKADCYFNRRLNGVEQNEYLKLNKSLDEASRHVAGLKKLDRC